MTESDIEIIRENVARGLATLTDEEIDRIDLANIKIEDTQWCPLGQARGWPESLNEIEATGSWSWQNLARLGFYPMWEDCEEFMSQEWEDQIRARIKSRENPTLTHINDDMGNARNK